MCNRIARVWEEFPDLRLGQLIYNACDKRGLLDNMFYVEDEELIKAIEEYQNNHNYFAGGN